MNKNINEQQPAAFWNGAAPMQLHVKTILRGVLPERRTERRGRGMRGNRVELLPDDGYRCADWVGIFFGKKFYFQKNMQNNLNGLM